MVPLSLNTNKSPVALQGHLRISHFGRNVVIVVCTYRKVMGGFEGFRANEGINEVSPKKRISEDITVTLKQFKNCYLEKEFHLRGLARIKG